MSDLKVGDMVVLIAGSMRMAVESVKANKVSTVWCNEGIIGRDIFPKEVLKKWEYRDEDISAPKRGTVRPSERFDDKTSDRSKKQRVGKRGNDRSEGNQEFKVRGKMGWDGKPREKKFFRKG